MRYRPRNALPAHGVAIALVRVAVAFVFLTSCSGGDGSIDPVVDIRAFTMSVAPTALTLQPGGGAALLAARTESVDASITSESPSVPGIGTVAVTISRSGGFEGSVTFTVQGLPTGVVASTLTIGPGSTTGNIAITATTSASASSGALSLNVSGSGVGVETQNAPVLLTVTAAASFTLSLSPAALSIDEGKSGTSTVTLSRTGGYAETVAMTSTGAPNGMIIQFPPDPAVADSWRITVNVGGSVPPTVYPINILGIGPGTAARNATLTITVTVPAVPSVTLFAGFQQVQQGQSTTGQLTLTRAGYSGIVHLTNSGAPAGMTVSFNPASTTAASTSLLIATTASVNSRSYSIQVQGSAPGVTINPISFSVLVTPIPAITPSSAKRREF